MRLLLRVLTVVLTVFLVFTAASGFLYPFLRPDLYPALGHPFTHDPALEGSWGGTTLAGAWAAHAGIAAVIVVPGLMIVGRLRRLTQRAA
ncbi:hypothetical protein [Planomonospora venezuelensis]|uniref:Uncharacterized protein n=1 Tax=Planomonospora venezuelensis TaxID=1999 RepID=A0A841D5N6_PLAVE|nr:hypothetical protein [Planomonospora venezuelensis]MBB5963668.1 hypothetical protein [Planomonospora venezuelensis]GIN01456.1 hypothetical protein Pve01_31140 [Planomonospora venezuelensis]